MGEDSFNNEYEELMTRLKTLILLHEKEIDQIITLFHKETKDYILHEVNEHFVIKINRGEGECTLNIGFPFPLLMTRTLNEDKNYDIHLFLRGEPVREYQRNQLFAIANQTHTINQEQFKETYNQLTKDICSITYVDPYTFMGDSIVGLYFVDSWLQTLQVPVVIHSKNNNILRSFYPDTYPLDDPIRITPGKMLIIRPDLLDVNWTKTMGLIETLQKEQLLVVPGRGLIIHKNTQGLEVFWNEQPDILLRNTNIEQYMSSMIRSYLGANNVALIKPPLQNEGKQVIVVNPFGSTTNKALPEQMVFSIYKKIAEKRGIKLLLVGGYYQNIYHSRWMRKFMDLVTTKGFLGDSLSINYYENLDLLTKELMSINVLGVITADTSISHLTNRLRLPNITIYNDCMWDGSSTQSLASDSPLGFCRFIPSQSPIVISKETDIDKIAQHIIPLLELLGKTKILDTSKPSLEVCKCLASESLTYYPWLSELYDAEKMLSELSQEQREINAQLVHSSYLISPHIKLSRLHNHD